MRRRTTRIRRSQFADAIPKRRRTAGSRNCRAAVLHLRQFEKRVARHCGVVTGHAPWSVARSESCDRPERISPALARPQVVVRQDHSSSVLEKRGRPGALISTVPAHPSPRARSQRSAVASCQTMALPTVSPVADPRRGSSPLVRDADGGQWPDASSVAGPIASRDGQGGLPKGLGILLDPAVLGKELIEGSLTGRHHATFCVEHNCTRTGCSLIEGEQVGHCRFVPSIPSLDISPLPVPLSTGRPGVRHGIRTACARGSASSDGVGKTCGELWARTSVLIGYVQ